MGGTQQNRSMDYNGYNGVRGKRGRMSEILNRVLALCAQGKIRISDHGYDELAEDGIFARDIIAGVGEAIVK